MAIFGFLIAALVAWYVYERSQRKTHAMPGGHRSDILLPYEAEFELYHNALSLCSKKTRVCLDELGIAYKSHPIDLIETGSYENIGRDYLAVHPGGILPLLVHKGHPIYESHEQIRYAAAHAPSSSPSLVPDDPAQRTEMDRWVDRASLVGDDPIAATQSSAGNCVPGLTVPLFAAMMIDIPVWRVFEGLLFHRLKQRPAIFLVLKVAGLGGLAKLKPAASIISKSARDLRTHLAALESQLEKSGGPWILGAQYTLADVSWVVIFERLAETACVDDFVSSKTDPRVASYWQALQARPSYQSAIAAHTHPTVTLGLERIREYRAQSSALSELLGSR